MRSASIPFTRWLHRHGSLHREASVHMPRARFAGCIRISAPRTARAHRGVDAIVEEGPLGDQPDDIALRGILRVGGEGRRAGVCGRGLARGCKPAPTARSWRRAYLRLPGCLRGPSQQLESSQLRSVFSCKRSCFVRSTSPAVLPAQTEWSVVGDDLPRASGSASSVRPPSATRMRSRIETIDDSTSFPGGPSTTGRCLQMRCWIERSAAATEVFGCSCVVRPSGVMTCETRLSSGCCPEKNVC
eukprot:scaffold211765_cov30-Tisochrysis_lutea.AAC.4